MIHVCNVPSPAATASLEIGREIVDMMVQHFDLTQEALEAARFRRDVKEIDYEQISNGKVWTLLLLVRCPVCSRFRLRWPLRKSDCPLSTVFSRSYCSRQLFFFGCLSFPTGDHWRLDRLAFLVTWIVLMVTAYKEKTLNVPVIGWVAKYFAAGIH